MTSVVFLTAATLDGFPVGQFFDARALDRIELSFAPATVPSGRPSLPRSIPSSALRSASAAQRHLVYDVVR